MEIMATYETTERLEMVAGELEVVADYSFDGSHFKICYDEETDGYWGINLEYIDKDGMVTKTLTGLEGFFSGTVEDTIRRIKTSILREAYMERGMSKIDAGTRAALEVEGYDAAYIKRFTEALKAEMRKAGFEA